jgi:molybdopterin-guanine dinucleotide biosynthesis protein A
MTGTPAGTGSERHQSERAARPVSAGAPRVAAAVLAGGRGSRLGGGKANLDLCGMTLAEHTVRALRSAGLEPFVVTKEDRPVEIEGVEVFVEPAEPLHPLAGVAAAIRAAGGRAVIVVACDLPLLPPEFFAWLAGLPEGTAVPAPNGQVQPLAARYAPGDLGPIESALNRGESARGAVQSLDPNWIDTGDLRAFGEPERLFFNVNTAADLRQAEAMLGESGGGEGTKAPRGPAAR